MYLVKVKNRRRLKLPIGTSGNTGGGNTGGGNTSGGNTSGNTNLEEYIRNQNDIELGSLLIQMPAGKIYGYEAPFDGFLFVTKYRRANDNPPEQETVTRFAPSITLVFKGNNSLEAESFVLPVLYGDRYIFNGKFTISCRYYKKRDYTGREVNHTLPFTEGLQDRS